MSKIEINNEIIVMRKVVRAAHVRIIHKLIRTSKSLKRKKGTEAEIAKNKRKAERMVQEVLAAKTINEDDVTRFALTNIEDIQDILRDSNTDAKTRVIAKFASCEILKEKIDEFKQRYPEFEKFLAPGRKKLQKLQKQAKKEETKLTVKKEEDEIESEKDETEDPENETRLESVKVEKEEPKKKKAKTETSTKQNGVSGKKESPKKNPVVRPVSKLATVKSFAEMLDDTEGIETVVAKDSPIKSDLIKEVDNFFMSKDGTQNYMRIVVPKAYEEEKEEEDDSEKKKGFKGADDWGKKRKFGESRYFNNMERTGKRDSDRNFSREQKEGWSSKQKFADNSEKKEEHLHPSWEAKKKQQEALKVGFQGKKTVFDD